MRKRLLALAATAVAIFFSSTTVCAQDGRLKPPPTDEALHRLAQKYITTPITKTVMPGGDVLLQRNMTPYLQATVQQSSSLPAADDHGHDHKDEMLRTFLNRPHPSVSTLNKYFAEAAAEFNVPVEILKAIAQVQSNWAQVSESMYGSWGIMGLLENRWATQISTAASILNTNTTVVKNDARTSVRAAAALLSLYQDGRPATELSDWFDAVKALIALPDASLNQELALRIFDVVKTGTKTITLWDEIIELEASDVTLSKTQSEKETVREAGTQRTLTADYGPAVANFAPSCNYGSRPTGAVVKYYFVHYVATGTYQGAINWFKDCASGVSAHYVVRNSDGQVSQVVAEADRAYSQGVSEYNNNGIGVEHEVLASNLAMWDSDPMLAGAAALCKDVCNRRGIPKIRRVTNGDWGIYGHSDVRSTDCPNMTPERWTAFMSRVNAASALAPTLYSVTNAGTGTQLTATWKANTEPNLAGYRLYYATNESLSGWALAANETTLTAATTSVTLNASQFVVPPAGDVYHFRLTAVVTDGTNPVVESNASDVYSRSSNTAGPRVLIVDGFDRFGGTGSWNSSVHSFAASYFKALRNKASLQISTVANEKVEDGTFSLSNYDIAVWFVGDESSANVVFSAAEKTAIRNFLNGGGKLLLSGSEIAYNIGRKAATATVDSVFMADYLKGKYVADGASTYTPATGITGTAFDGLRIPFGIVYPEDFPDAVDTANGSTAIFTYNGTTNKGGIAYKGTFGTSSMPGALVFLSYTLETAADTSMAFVMEKTLAYFDVPVVTLPTANDDLVTTQSGSAKRTAVLSNDFNNGVPLNLSSVSIVSNPTNGTITVDAAGNVTYVSNAGFSGTDSYRYQVQNTAGQSSNIAKVTVTVVAPLACNPMAPEVDDAAPKRDLRGAWVSTVSNIDWPSSRTLSTAQQQAELINILNTLAATGINTVYLQVRPESDALYQSSIEPWSYWLTGAQGTAPNPLWDPLEFAVREAHARGMELHAWINPYRAKQSTPTLAANHVVNVHPDWTLVVTSGATMLNPGLPAVRQYLKEVIADIATRYDVDGIHFDDYFYPAGGVTTQDNTTYANNNPTAIANISDWRRNNVNLLIAGVYDTLAVINTAANRGIVFGVSPFGIWKSGTPAGITGQSSYSDLYCDPVAWLQAGKVDYVAPQLYWKVTGAQDYNALSKWWNDQGTTNGRYIYPGLALYRMSDASNWAPSDITTQIDLNRDASREQVRGQILFSTKQLMTNVKDIRTVLQNGQYKYKSVAPAMPWKDAVCPVAPVNIRREADTLRWDTPVPAADGDLPRRYLVYRFANAAEVAGNRNDGRKLYAVVYGTKLGLPVADTSSGYFSVTALDKANNESEQSANIALPLTGLQLTVRLSGNTALIGWRTLTEINTDRFEVERSRDGVRFTRMAIVAAAGNSSAPKEYGTTDFLASDGTFYYRIKSVDKDGRSSYSEIRSITYRQGAGLIVGPNPFRSHINISGLQGVKQAEIVDLAGRSVISKVVNNQSTLQLQTTGLPNGVYYLRIVKADGEVSVVKVVKI